MVRRRPGPPAPRKLRTARVAGFTLTEGIHADGSSLPWHTHDGSTICFVLEGSFTEVMAGSALLCVPATLKFTPAGERHCDRFDRGDARGLLIETEPPRMEAIRPYSAVLEERLTFQGGRLAAIAQRIHHEFRQMDSAAPLAMEGMLLELLAAASREQEMQLTGTEPAWLRRTREMIHADPACHRSLGVMAQAAGVHPVTLARAFRKAYGCSMGEYLRRLRIGRAARQLADSETPLAEIALAAGFADQSHFSNVFRRQTGMSPSSFRRSVRTS
ncbi:MAG: helix-turn-helix domain-containing protein [Gemmatimonadales bacterium]